MGSAEAASIGKRIREARRSRGMTQVLLAEAAGISASHMGDIETGRSSFSVEVLQKICRALHVSADSILLTAIPETVGTHSADLEKLLADCSEEEIAFILESAETLKLGMKRLGFKAKEQRG